MSSSKRHTGLPRAFDLAAWSYFLDFAIAPVAIAVLMVVAWCDVDAGGVAIAIAALCGVLAWTLAEYWIHRAIFHGRTPFEPMHQLHHALPRDMIGVASWGTFVGFSAVWALAELVAGAALGSAFSAGVVAGYLFYCAIHVRFHHHGAGARLSWYVAFMSAHHVGHHRGGRGNFGVSSPIWDLVFRTYRPSR